MTVLNLRVKTLAAMLEWRIGFRFESNGHQQCDTQGCRVWAAVYGEYKAAADAATGWYCYCYV